MIQPLQNQGSVQGKKNAGVTRRMLSDLTVAVLVLFA